MTTGGNVDRQQYTRISDIVNEPQEMLMPIRGYEKMPIVSLEEAVIPLISILPEIQDYAYVAKQRCKSVPPDGLTQDESASIMLYSMEWEPHEECLYFALNATLRTEDRRKLKPWFLYLKLILTALEKLPSSRYFVFRGVNLNLSEQYTEGKTFVWWGFSSCTTSMGVLENEQFLGKTGQRTMFNIECDSGKDISRHSYFQSEKEVLLLAARQFIVVSCLRPAPGLHMIQLKETKPPITLLQPVTNQFVQIKPTPEQVQTKKNKFQQFAITVAGGNEKGQELNQLSDPHGIFIGNDKSVYIADWSNHRIVKWKLNSNIGQITVDGNGKGNQNNQLNYPTDIIFDKENNAFIISDWGNERVIRYFDQNQINKQIIISNIKCCGLTIDKNGYIYASDHEKNEVRRWKRGDETGELVAGGNGKGTDLNQLNYPRYIFIDEDYSLYISDSLNHRVMKWKKNAKEGIIVAGGNGEGGNLNQLSKPRGIIIDYLGQIYVADSRNNRIMRWCEGKGEGDIVVGGNGKGNQSNQLNLPLGLSFDNEENLYVVDNNNHRIQKYENISNETFF
ncbi:unnamed protein product [Adineta steineri]|uniref:NAD(P)(+)--arginine ADP-ribosyltransferase n=1 Tax=Adineta steineri TaxID=433720 RepID=A0A814KJ46_9BILA|nr:unnamed protein product [Adineta steineri]CAF1052056.1 unnamed protein product [Adineta steineri]